MRHPAAIVQGPVEYIFYGNYFYGLCAVALTLETVVQLRLDIRDPLLYVLIFLATVLFYNYPYARNHSQIDNWDPRTHWHQTHRRFIHVSQAVFTISLLAGVLLFICKYTDQIASAPFWSWLIVFVFPITALLYYGSNFAATHHSLRQVGWAKPFIIGFVWTGVVYVYPLLYAHWIGELTIEPGFYHILQFLKSVMYISMLAILFDIKDYASDKYQRLNTLIVRIGIRRTLFGFIFPLGVLGLLMFFAYAFIHEFHPLKVLLTMIPFLLLFWTTFSFGKRRSLLFYLIVIDGLMLAKAFFGIFAALI